MTTRNKVPAEITQIDITIDDAGTLNAITVYDDDGLVTGYKLILDGTEIGLVEWADGYWIGRTPRGDQACSWFDLMGLLVDYATAWAESARTGSWPSNGEPLGEEFKQLKSDRR